MFRLMPKDTLIYLFLGFISLIFSIFLFFSGIAIPGATVSLKFDYIGYILLSLGGASAIYFTLIAKDAFEKGITFFSFLLSGLFSSRHFQYTGGALIVNGEPFIHVHGIAPSFFYFICISLIFFKIEIVFIFLLFWGSFVFNPWGSALFILLVFLYLLKVLKRKEILLYLYLPFLVVVYIFDISSVNKAVFLMGPLAEACAIFFFFYAKTGEDYFVSFSIFVINHFYYLFLLDIQGSYIYFSFLIYFFICISGYISFITTMGHHLPLSKWSNEFHILINTGKNSFLNIFSGGIALLSYINFMGSAVESSHNGLLISGAYTLIFHAGVILLLEFIFSFVKKNFYVLKTEQTTLLSKLVIYSSTLSFIFLYLDGPFSILLLNLSLFWHIYKGIEEIMADHVHQEMTRNLILVYLRLFLLIVIKDVFLSLVSSPNKSKNLMGRS